MRGITNLANTPNAAAIPGLGGEIINRAATSVFCELVDDTGNQYLRDGLDALEEHLATVETSPLEFRRYLSDAIEEGRVVVSDTGELHFIG